MSVQQPLWVRLVNAFRFFVVVVVVCFFEELNSLVRFGNLIEDIVYIYIYFVAVCLFVLCFFRCFIVLYRFIVHSLHYTAHFKLFETTERRINHKTIYNAL